MLSTNVDRKLNNKDQVIGIERPNKINLVTKKYFGQRKQEIGIFH